MRNRSRGFSSADMKGFIFETVSLSPGGPKGRWFTTEEKNISDKRHFPWPNIWHDSKPTSVLRNALTEDVISLIESTVFINLMSEACHEPIELPAWLNLRETASNGDIHFYNEELSPTSLSILTIKMVLDCAYHLWINRKYPDPMIHWTSIPTGPNTFPSAEFPFSSSELSGHDVAAILQIMRHVGPYEGGTDYMFERRLMCAISLLFSSYNVGYTSSNSNNKSSELPLLVIGDFGPLTIDIKRRMAMLAEPTLLKLIAQHKDSQAASPLPNHTFVFGIHLSRHMISIFIHLPTHIPNASGEGGDSTKFEFHQIAVTYHNITALQPEYSDVIHPDDRFLDRWQVLVALLTIRSHVRRLHELLGSPPGHSGAHSELLVNDLPPDLHCSADNFVPLTEYISAIRRSWTGGTPCSTMGLDT
ncbi:hypothetical protein QCA50_004564 [Cerrena zonata]|uniref:Uncharacterized protein n=1 Tax=Cerrena zonata TaxID=2478898 RepID=A0AAW0GI03_9APHY